MCIYLFLKRVHNISLEIERNLWSQNVKNQSLGKVLDKLVLVSVLVFPQLISTSPTGKPLEPFPFVIQAFHASGPLTVISSSASSAWQTLTLPPRLTSSPLSPVELFFIALFGNRVDPSLLYPVSRNNKYIPHCFGMFCLYVPLPNKTMSNLSTGCIFTLHL